MYWNRCLAAAFTAAFFVGTATAADWPQWRGPNRDGKSADTGLLKAWPKDGPKLLWTANSLKDVGTGLGSVSVVGDKIYLAGKEAVAHDSIEFCTCLNLADGKPVWKTPLGGATPKFQIMNWGSAPRSTPTVDGDQVFVLSAGGDLVCLTKADGKIQWQKNLVKDFGGTPPNWGYSESPLVDGDVVVCTPGTKSGMVALNRKTGDTVWNSKAEVGPPHYSSVVVATAGGVRQYVQQTLAGGYGVDAKTGALLWKGETNGRLTAVIPTPVVSGEYIFFSFGYQQKACELFKIGAGGKAEAVYTKNRTLGNHHGGVIEYDGYVYGHADGSAWVCFDFKKGGEEPKWSKKDFNKGSISFADGHFYCYSERDGTVALIRATPDSWDEKGRFKIPALSPTRTSSQKNASVWPHPVIAQGKLFLRDYEVLYCYDVSGAKN